MKLIRKIGRWLGFYVTKDVYPMNKKGSQNPNAKLSDDEVLKIRELWYIGHRNTRVISRTFKISPSNVMKIIKRETWVHI